MNVADGPQYGGYEHRAKIAASCQKSETKVRVALSPSPLEDVRAVHQMCREGRLYDIARWIAEGKPLQLEPEAISKGTRHKTALQIALEDGQHSASDCGAAEGWPPILPGVYGALHSRYSPHTFAVSERVERRCG